MISERTLKRWRRDALNTARAQSYVESPSDADKVIDVLNDRILKLTQELLDQHLMRRI